MASLSDELIDSAEQLALRWYEAWRRSPHPHPDIDEVSLKDSLPGQLRLIGEQLRNLNSAENPKDMWKLVERLDPELRVLQRIPIEEVVQEYAILVDAVRNWIAERAIEVPFVEYSYFYSAIFELTAESVRRYSIEQASNVSGERAKYLAALAHQMRGPLSSISVLIDQIKRSEFPQQDGRAAIVEIADRNLRRVVSLISNVLKLERFKPEEIQVRPQLVSPADIVENVFADNAHDAGEKDLHLQNVIDRSLKATLDPELFLDAMSNLIQNAVKYTTSGFVRAESAEQGDEIIFKVVDSGPGVPAEQAKTLFRTFQPGKAGGVGIGLVIVHRAIAAQGGTVGVESRPGKGLVFWVRLPRVVQARAVA